VETLTGELVGADEEDAVRRGLRRAFEARHKRFRPRALVVVVEAMAEIAVKNGQ